MVLVFYSLTKADKLTRAWTMFQFAGFLYFKNFVVVSKSLTLKQPCKLRTSSSNYKAGKLSFQRHHLEKNPFLSFLVPSWYLILKLRFKIINYAMAVYFFEGFQHLYSEQIVIFRLQKVALTNTRYVEVLVFLKNNLAEFLNIAPGRC